MCNSSMVSVDSTVESVLTLDINVDFENAHESVKQIISAVRPNWLQDQIIFKVRSWKWYLVTM